MVALTPPLRLPVLVAFAGFAAFSFAGFGLLTLGAHGLQRDADRSSPVVAVDAVDGDAEAAAIAGLWSLHPESRADGDPMRFYFFHEKGIGLYRYGKVGLNHTNSFTWRVDDDVLTLRFKKTGEVAETRFRVDERGGAKQLVLVVDPKEPFRRDVPYTFVPAPLAAPDLAGFIGPRAPAARACRCAHACAMAEGGVGGRLWIDRVQFATGGEGFALYQLQAAAIDGRGVGWFHQGDFDDWSTEALSYRCTPAGCPTGSALELTFAVRQERAVTTVVRGGGTHGDLILLEDPRSFWHTRRYVDGGPSFGALLVEATRTAWTRTD